MAATIEGWSCPVPLQDQPNILLGHGGGGKLSSELIEHLFLPAFDNVHLRDLADAAALDLPPGRISMSTDSFVVRPRFFPGGNIGELAINGTVNDVAMRGGTPRYISVAFILEEGLPLAELGVIVESMARAAKHAGVDLVTGDTKVVDLGHGDGVYITTTGIGVIPDGLEIVPQAAQPGDAVIVSGTIGDHGMAIMSVREGLEFESAIESDTAALCWMIADVIAASSQIHALRDPTRGGLAATLVEIAGASEVGIAIEDAALPVSRLVDAACEILGMDPLHVANEGKVVAFVGQDDAEAVLEAMRRHPEGVDATIIGEVVDDHHGMVVSKTALGSHRIIDTHIGEQLPRIC